jgi:hypothetical protein
MNILAILVPISALAVAFVGVSPAASAQTKMAAAKPAVASNWTCPSSTIEIAPVSEDTSGKPTAWVMVHRVKGEIIAAERVDAREVERIRALPCGPSLKSTPAPLVG